MGRGDRPRAALEARAQRRGADHPASAREPKPRALIVAGPTASGKSALALVLAERLGGTVINADSMQIYRELHILTARPSAEDEAVAPHRLYGIRPAAEAADAAWWRGAALADMEAAHAEGRLPILCGGTGLYFAALRGGLADIPTIPPEIRAAARARLEEDGAPALHAALAVADPETAARLRPSDSQRIARAWEVVQATGRGLSVWQTEARAQAPDWDFRAILLDPPRDTLREAVSTRFDLMMEAGALAEVAALRAQNLDPALPAMRAHGVPELIAHLDGVLPLGEARARAIANVTRYVKRQATWFRHHDLAEPEASRLIAARFTHSTQLSESGMADLTYFIRSRG